jgi:hypothetical protein
MAIEYTDHFHSKALQNLPKFGFLVMKIYHLAALPPKRQWTLFFGGGGEYNAKKPLFCCLYSLHPSMYIIYEQA